MKKIIWVFIFLISVQLMAKTERFALIIGANNGGKERVQLEFAHSDAEAISKVLNELGGVNPQDQLTLLDPSNQEINKAFSLLNKKLKRAKQQKIQTQVLFYYSGHSDENGLLIGDHQVEYGLLKKKLKGLKSDVLITILDSCASGAMIRKKGGKWRPSFLADSSTLVKGHAILTSASASEAAQESNRIGGSFFTHYIISGLRGAADRSNDKKVTLNEAYEYAFHKTLKRTQGTIAGPQHPNYDFQLAGSGELVLTDLRSTSSLLVFTPKLLGKFFVRDRKGNLVAEIDKVYKKEFSFGLEPGDYSIIWKHEGKLLKGNFELKKGKVLKIHASIFTVQVQELTVARGKTQKRTRKSVPISFAIVPGLSMNGLMEKRRVVNNFSMGFPLDDGDDLHGLSMGALASMKKGTVSGIQMSGLFNMVGENAYGIQLGGLFNIVQRDTIGIQMGGIFNFNHGDALGIQMGGLFNRTKGDIYGLGIAGIYNRTRDVYGLQIGGIFNETRNVYGLQISGVNVAKKVRGLQIGIINIADDSSFSFGLINIIKNGRIHFSTLLDTDMKMLFELKHGGQYWHMIYGVSVDLTDPTLWDLTMGIGFHIPLNDKLFMDIDLISYNTLDLNKSFTDNDWDANNNKLRFVLGYTLNRYLAIVGSASLQNIVQKGDRTRPDKVMGRLLKDAKGNKDKYDVYMYPSLSIGLQFF